MRLRQLGTTQSVTFFAPPEVHQSILDVCRKSGEKVLDSSHVDSSHVVCWLLEQTCHANENLQNLYLAQGTDFCYRTNAQWRNGNFLTESSHRTAYLNVSQRTEHQTLDQLYGVVKVTQPGSVANMQSAQLKSFIEKLAELRRAANVNGNYVQSSALEEVEQEREVEFQVEQVCQIQKPPHCKALKFPSLHTAISDFAKTGKLTGGQGYEHVFDALARTSIGQKYNVRRTTSRLFVSVEFMRTIEPQNLVWGDDFLVSL